MRQEGADPCWALRHLVKIKRKWAFFFFFFFKAFYSEITVDSEETSMSKILGVPFTGLRVSLVGRSVRGAPMRSGKQEAGVGLSDALTPTCTCSRCYLSPRTRLHPSRFPLSTCPEAQGTEGAVEIDPLPVPIKAQVGRRGAGDVTLCVAGDRAHGGEVSGGPPPSETSGGEACLPLWLLGAAGSLGGPRARGRLTPSPPCVSVCPLPACQDTVLVDRMPTLPQHDLL